MTSRQLRRSFAIFTLTIILSWTILPGLAMADWLKAGNSIDITEPITGGEAITGVKPMKLGEFMVPGDIYKYGSSYEGVFTLTSGTIIVPVTAQNQGLFLIPSTLNGTSYGDFLKAGDLMSGGESPTGGQVPDSNGKPATSGEAVSGGEGPNGGTSGNAGESVTSGEGPNGGNAPNVGEGPNGGKTSDGGKGPNGGNAPDGGEGTAGGSASDGGEGPNGGNASDGGEGPNGGDGSGGGEGPNGGDGSEGGTGPNGGSAGSGDGTSGGATGGGPTIDAFLAAWGFKGEFDKYNSYRKDALTLFDGILATAAGFKITDLKKATGNKNLFRVEGDAKVMKGDNFFSRWVNKRYSNYLGSFEHRKDVVVGDSKGEYKRKWYDYKKRTHNDVTYQPRTDKELKQKKIQGFLKEVNSKTTITNALKDNLKDWVPNKEFFNLKNMMKGNGLTNVLFSVTDQLVEKHNDPTRTGTDMAAAITTDVIVGAAQTAVSAGAGWAATAMTAAAVGSVVPGVGTAVGVIVGLGIGALTATPWGKKVTGKIEAGVKTVFEGAKNLGKSLFKKFGWGS